MNARLTRHGFVAPLALGIAGGAYEELADRVVEMIGASGGVTCPMPDVSGQDRPDPPKEEG